MRQHIAPADRAGATLFAQESVDLQSISWARERFPGYFPALDAKIAQARLKPSISWPIPFLRWEVIASVRAIIHSALKENQLP